MLSVLTSLSVGSAVCDEHGRVLMADEAYAAVLGGSVDAVVGLSREAITHPEDNGMDVFAIREHHATGKPFELTKRYRRLNGDIIWVQNRVARLSKDRYLLLSRPFPEGPSRPSAHSPENRITLGGVISEAAWALAYQARRFSLSRTAALLEQASDSSISEASC